MERKRTKYKEEVDPNVLQLTELEALRWGKMDAEMRNVLQGIRLEDLEIESLTRTYVIQKQTREAMKLKLLAEVERRKKEYEAFTKQLAEKYHVDLARMAIDPETGVIRVM